MPGTPPSSKFSLAIPWLNSPSLTNPGPCSLSALNALGCMSVVLYILAALLSVHRSAFCTTAPLEALSRSPGSPFQRLCQSNRKEAGWPHSPPLILMCGRTLVNFSFRIALWPFSQNKALQKLAPAPPSPLPAHLLEILFPLTVQKPICLQ